MFGWAFALEKYTAPKWRGGGGNSRSANLGWPALLDVLEAGMQQLVVECIRVVKIEFTLVGEENLVLGELLVEGVLGQGHHLFVRVVDLSLTQLIHDAPSKH